MSPARSLALAALSLATVVPAAAQRSAGDIVTQPARDVGASKEDIPQVLLDAADDPYRRLRTCRQITGAIRALNEELGPDFGPENTGKNRSLLARGGALVINSFVPFRGIVREVSGAAAADRRLAAATQAGIARRGYLRGVYATRGCKTGL